MATKNFTISGSFELIANDTDDPVLVSSKAVCDDGSSVTES